MLQLELFPASTRDLEFKIEKVRATTESTRRGLFARHAELRKMYDELKYEFDSLKMALCKRDSNDL